ncbi:MAG: hypothetical protein ACLU6Y_03570 [Ruminococcus sp.]
MDRLLDEIESYWSTRTEGYSEVNEKELKGMQKGMAKDPGKWIFGKNLLITTRNSCGSWISVQALAFSNDSG